MYVSIDHIQPTARCAIQIIFVKLDEKTYFREFLPYLPYSGFNYWHLCYNKYKCFIISKERSSFKSDFHYHWWTASIKPRLLFSHSGIVSWGLPFLQFILNVCNVLMYCVFRALLSVCFCMGHFVPVPLNLILSTLFPTCFL